ncbi:glycerophosphodiester phosphodiesterase family protein [Thiohalocapsa sp.]|uniref:glycerophosphodiester phosphodiesterase family protein n=1 Tax=Thiohalocapsa sp. TaxID=2497641 RepID=UPI0025DF5F7E|nr:glycerophosphodiester phosphodiesterase family protein [Thiohalocapsa sp.]
MKTFSDTWYDVYAQGLFGRAVRSGLAYDVVFKAIGVVVLAPLSAWVLGRLIRTSGAVSVTNEAIAGFLLSLPGLAFVLLAAALTLTAFYTEQAGLMHIAAGASRGPPPRWHNALFTALTALPRLLTLALLQAGILLAWLLPLAAVAAITYRTLLGAHDINWYLAERPPEFVTALVIGALLATVAAVAVARLLVAWGISIPLCLYERVCGRAALRRSAELLRGRRWRAFRLVVLNLLLALAFSALVLWAADAALGALLRVFDGARALVFATALAVVLLGALATVLSFGVLAVLAISIMHLYLGVMDVDGLPAPLWDSAARTTRVPRLAIAAGLVVLVLAAGGLATHALSDLRLGRETLVTAHRGSSAAAPENTLAALYQAMSDGADFAEIDVQETADGALVLLHDADLMRIAGLPVNIWEAQLDDLRRVDVGSRVAPEFAGERIPTLDEALKLAGPRLRLNIELKYNGHDQQLAERVVEALRAAGCGQYCIVTSLNQAGLARVRELAPEIRIGQIVTAALGNTRRLDVDLLSMNQAHATPGAVRSNRRAGLETHVWTVNREADMARMLDYGVDNIITDRPKALRELIDERAELSDVELLLLALGRRLRE